MPVTTGFDDVDNGVALDIATKFVTKEYLLNFYPDLVPAMLTPQLYLWGNNVIGQLGTNNTSNYSSPVETVSKGTNWARVSGGNQHIAAIKTDGTLWTWGRNDFGQLGDSTTSNRSSPVTTFGGGTTWKQVACGYYHSAAVKTDGTLWCWGRGDQGMLGDNTISSRSSPITTSGGGTTWKQVATGYFHTLGIKTDGTLWTWGQNQYGQLGDATVTNRYAPIQFSGSTSLWKQVAAGNSLTAALKTDGTLWTCGYNKFGELGDNTSSNRSVPTQVTGSATNWKQVSCGDVGTMAIKTDGTLWSWGHNAYGELGDNTTSSRSSPVQITGGGTNWVSSARGAFHAAAVKTDGTLWCWGRGSEGQLGNNSAAGNKSSPIPIILNVNSWRQVACGYYFTVATTESEGW
jgi:alpha-tubulin suppressor-like RCC1 family protein